jgi:serine protease Do
MTKRSVLFAGLLLVLVLAFGGLLIANFGNVKHIIADTPIEFRTTPPIQTPNADVRGLNDAFMEISKEVTPTVVYIEVTTNSSGKDEGNKFEFNFPFGPDFQMPEEMPNRGSGSGVIISNDGYIVTNNHVVKNASSNGIKVILTDKREFTAELIGTDPVTDVAVIKVKTDNLPVASVGNSDNVQVGQWVLAVGNPLGLNNTVTAGIVSALGRNINMGSDNYAINNFIQTDAAINPGNSGGALVDINGLVVGINTAIKTTNGYYQGYGFAIPINLAKQVASELIKNGKVSRGYIGVTIKDVDIKEAKGLGLDKAQGVLVQDVLKGGAGEEAGVRTGDVILSVDGNEVNAANQLQTIIGSKHPGDNVSLKIFREGTTIDKNVRLKPREEAVSETSRENLMRENSSSLASKSFDNIGISVSDLTGSLKQKYNIDNGIYITSVKRFSEGFDRGLREGLVITEADKQNIESIDQFDRILSKKNPGEVIVLKVKTADGSVRLIAVELA